MIIICIQGGLGNQMFQYALFYKLKTLGKEVAIDTSLYKTGVEKREFRLNIFPNIYYEQATMEVCDKLRGKYDNFFEKVRRKFGLRKYYFREVRPGFYDKIYGWNTMYLDGYWQSERYFREIKKDILRQFEFPQMLGEENIKMMSWIVGCNSVSVHIRRGDYLNNKKRYGNIWENGYYEKAIKYIRNKVDSPKFFFFSDDIEWVKQNYKNDDFIYVDNEKENDYIDMQLMSMCKNNIIANSSYSWWGAWLNSREDKIVVAPAQWNLDTDNTDIFCDEWITI
ncbi:MAG: alpha-1,2-fucosyltransferase [Lachnospiraceae bacterium]|nr:alpha-1,2-fucosyltransferase [Lachnospiraceae bacterium]